MKFGDAMGIILMLIWLSVAVGPWYLGVIIFVTVWVINLATL